jgi:hypothetical protein
VTEKESLLVRNMLNGVPAETLAGVLDMDVADIRAAFAEAMRRVAEYVLVHCVPYFPCTLPIEAQRNRVMVIDIIGRIQRWDDYERDIMLNLLKGRNVDAPRELIAQIMKRTLDAIPHYLTFAEQSWYTAGRRAFVAEHRQRVIEAVEQFVSFRNPLLYKNIIHVTGDVDALTANMRNL